MGERVDAHWLRAQQDVAGRAAHEMKNALNGVAVNLEVVRVRAERGGDAAAIMRFATVAAAQLELLVGQVDALLGVTRQSAGVADVALVARQLHALLEHAGPAESELHLAGADALAAPTSADVVLVRLLLARLFTGLVDQPGQRTVDVRVDPDGRVAVTARAARPVELDAESRELAMAGGVTVSAAGDGALTLIFPATSVVPTV